MKISRRGIVSQVHATKQPNTLATSSGVKLFQLFRMDFVDLWKAELRIIYIILTSLLCWAIGWLVISKLRQSYKTSASPLQYSLVPILSPIILYIFLCTFAWLGLFDQIVADFASFYYMIGILWQLAQKSTGVDTIRLCVHVCGGHEVKEIWLKNIEVTVGEAEILIAEALHVNPGKISIESGKGKFLDNPNTALVPLISETTLKEDLFGFSTVHCYVALLDQHINLELDDDLKRHNPLARMIPGIMEHRGAIKYGMEITLSGKIPNAANDAKAFDISCVDLYASAAPSTSSLALGSSACGDTVRLVGWREEGSNQALARENVESHLSGQKLKNGDAILLENGGRYVHTCLSLCVCKTLPPLIAHPNRFMAATKGSKIAWSSTVPRSSGAFVIEIVEKASLNRIEKGLETIGKKILHKETPDEGTLRAGDVFRLRSVKFPGYELGVTSARLTGEYFLLGLKKVDHAIALFPPRIKKQMIFCLFRLVKRDKLAFLFNFHVKSRHSCKIHYT
jgi:hypothetical protein